MGRKEVQNEKSRSHPRMGQRSNQNAGHDKVRSFRKDCRCDSQKPRPTCQQGCAILLRKEGKQLEIGEKKRLGLSAKTFFSHDALSDLTEEGLQHPLQAHDLTILRATLAASRAESILDQSGMGISQCEVLAPFPDQCTGCKRIDGKMFTKETAEPLGPHDCFRQACAVAFAPKVESIKQPEKPSSVKRQGANPLWKVW